MQRSNLERLSGKNETECETSAQGLPEQLSLHLKAELAKADAEEGPKDSKIRESLLNKAVLSMHSLRGERTRIAHENILKSLNSLGTKASPELILWVKRTFGSWWKRVRNHHQASLTASLIEQAMTEEASDSREISRVSSSIPEEDTVALLTGAPALEEPANETARRQMPKIPLRKGEVRMLQSVRRR